jgi:hypothetical protein
MFALGLQYKCCTHVVSSFRFRRLALFCSQTHECCTKVARDIKQCDLQTQLLCENNMAGPAIACSGAIPQVILSLPITITLRAGLAKVLSALQQCTPASSTSRLLLLLLLLLLPLTGLPLLLCCAAAAAAAALLFSSTSSACCAAATADAAAGCPVASADGTCVAAGRSLHMSYPVATLLCQQSPDLQA